MLAQLRRDFARRAFKRERQLGLEYLHGLCEHLFLARGQTAPAFPGGQALDDLRNLTQLARTDMLHIFTVALIPSLALAADNAVQLRGRMPSFSQPFTGRKSSVSPKAGRST